MEYDRELSILRDQQKSDWEATIVGMQGLAQHTHVLSEQTRVLSEQTRVLSEQTQVLSEQMTRVGERMEGMQGRSDQMFGLLLSHFRDLDTRLTIVEKRLAS